MKTISIQTGMIPQFGNTRALAGAAEDFVARQGRTAHSSAVAWRPAAPALPASKRRQASSAQSAGSIWISPPRELIGDKFMLGVLALAAAAGIGYGFLSLLDLVQNWGVFNAYVSRLLQS